MLGTMNKIQDYLDPYRPRGINIIRDNTVPRYFLFVRIPYHGREQWFQEGRLGGYNSLKALKEEFKKIPDGKYMIMKADKLTVGNLENLLKVIKNG